MTVTTMPTPPIMTDGTTYGAELLRRAWSRSVGDAVGVFTPDALAVSLDGFEVTVAPGPAALPAPATEVGVYLAEALTATEFTLTPADATRGRLDTLVAYPVPPVDGDDVGTWVIELIDGLPSATPVAPSAAGPALELARFTVPSAASGLAPSVTDRRFTNGQALIGGPARSGATLPAEGLRGQLFTESGTGRTYVHTGIAWRSLGGIEVASSIGSVAGPTTGQVVYESGSSWLHVRDGGQWRVIGGKTPYAKGSRVGGTGQSLAANQYTKLTFNTWVSLPEGMYDGTTNEFVVLVSGFYDLEGAVALAAAFTGVATVFWRKNGADLPAGSLGGWNAASGFNTMVPARSMTEPFAVGDRISLVVHVNAATTTVTDANHASSMTLSYKRPPA